jgi:molecular chaperone DnaK
MPTVPPLGRVERESEPPHATPRSGEPTPAAPPADDVSAAKPQRRTPAPRPTRVSEKIIGIDLGTTNSVVAVMEGEAPRVIANRDGQRLTPSVVAFTIAGDVLVGDVAKRQAITNPAHTVYSIKRFMGRRQNEVSLEERIVPYAVVGGPDEYVKVKVRDHQYTPAEVSAIILRELRDAAEAYVGERIERAVITVPAYFNDAQRQATKNAGEIAGLKVERIINEPTAAAMAYGLDSAQATGERRIVVFDLGGGTLDVSILTVGEGVFEVISTCGDTHLGGDDFDQALVDAVADDFRREHGIDLRKEAMALARLREQAEEAKKRLSKKDSVEISLPFVTADASGPKHLHVAVSRAKFETIIAPLVEHCRKPVETAMADAHLTPAQIDDVVLVGGSTRIPKVRQLVRETLQKEPRTNVDPDEVVALGAAIQGGVLSGGVKNVLLMDVTPMALGIETVGGVMTPLVERNTTIPTAKKQTFSTASDNQTAVTVKVYQGERMMAADNRLLGRFSLQGIAPAPRGKPKIEVTFDIDHNGILQVSAKDRGTGKEQSIRVDASAGLSRDEIERMRRELEGPAQASSEPDRLPTLRRQATDHCAQAEWLLGESPHLWQRLDTGPVKTAIAEARKAAEGDDATAILQAVEGLNRATQALIHAAYGGAGLLGT